MKISSTQFFWLGALCSLLCVAGISALSQQPGASTVQWFIGLALVNSLAAVMVVWRYQLAGQTIPFTYLLGTALLFRLLALWGAPLLEDDFYRYLWDGYMMVSRGDPYSLAPAHFFDAHYPELFEDILSSINYPDIATVYGPVCQWLFALAYLVAPAEVWPLQAFAALADVVVLCLLRTLTKHNALLLYGWSALLIKEFALTAHPDIFSILFAVIALVLVQRRVPVLAGAALGLAVGVKVFAILLLPFLLLFPLDRRGWVGALYLLLGFGATIAITTAVFGSLAIWVPEGLQAMAESWMFNAPLYALLLNVLTFSSIKGLLLLLFVTAAFIGFVRQLRACTRNNSATKSDVPAFGCRPVLRGDWLFGAFLLCLPVLNAWYLPWILPFAVLYPSRWAWTASFAVLLSYWNSSNFVTDAETAYLVPPLVLLAECGLVVVAAAWDWRRPLARG